LEQGTPWHEKICKVPDGLMAIRSDDDLIRYTKYSKDLRSREKRKRHDNPFRKGGNTRRRGSKYHALVY